VLLDYTVFWWSWGQMWAAHFTDSCWMETSTRVCSCFWQGISCTLTCTWLCLVDHLHALL